jgi:hypothetical protein
MKTKKEIEQLANDYGKSVGNTDGTTAFDFKLGYSQCQRDMADKWFEYPKNIPPIHSENYLIVDNSYIQISLFRGDYNKFQHELIGANITHWMPLPNKPLNKQD